MAGDEVNVNKTVQKIEKIDHTKVSDGGGANAAYQELKTEYDNYAKTHKPDEVKAYWKDVTQQLSDKKVLPDLSLAWGKEQGINDESAYSIKNSNKYSDGTRDAEMDKTMADALSKKVETLDNSGRSGGFLWLYDRPDGRLSAKEIDKGLETLESENEKRIAAQTVRDQQAPLFKGEPPLAQALDHFTQNGQNSDGTITREDMEQFVKHYDHEKLLNPNFKDGGALTKENRDYVQNILEGKNPALSQHGFTMSDLAKNGGFEYNQGDNYQTIVQNFNKVQPVPEAVVEKPSTNVDSQKPKVDDSAARKDLIANAKPVAGQGMYKVAENLLGAGATKEEKNQLAGVLTQTWKEAHPNKPFVIRMNEPILTEDNLQKVLDNSPALKKKYEASLPKPTA